MEEIKLIILFPNEPEVLDDFDQKVEIIYDLIKFLTVFIFGYGYLLFGMSVFWYCYSDYMHAHYNAKRTVIILLGLGLIGTCKFYYILYLFYKFGLKVGIAAVLFKLPLIDFYDFFRGFGVFTIIIISAINYEIGTLSEEWEYSKIIEKKELERIRRRK